jgi:MoaA/NifB/PqqE/SkfB family radical SAM enzyme
MAEAAVAKRESEVTVSAPQKLPPLPTPRPNERYYFWYRAFGMLRHPKRLVNFLKFYFSKFTSSNVTYYPMIMDVEPTQRCNYRCIMCDPASLFKIRRKDMPFENFKKLIDEQHGLIEVKVQGVGEPTLNKDFMKMVEYALSKHLWVRTTVNGSLLDRNDTYKQLIDSGIHDINISCDGASKDTYEKIRIGGDWEHFSKNCKLINDYNNAKPNPVPLRAWVVMQEENKHEFDQFPRIFKELGFKEMCYSFAMHNYGRDGENEHAASDYPWAREDLERAMKLGEEIGIKVLFWSFPKMSRDNFCKIPFQRLYVTTDMHLVPCCYIANQEVVDWGSYDDFKDTWFNKYVPFRESHRNKEKPLYSYCENCYNGCNK